MYSYTMNMILFLLIAGVLSQSWTDEEELASWTSEEDLASLTSEEEPLAGNIMWVLSNGALSQDCNEACQSVGGVCRQEDLSKGAQSKAWVREGAVEAGTVGCSWVQERCDMHESPIFYSHGRKCTVCTDFSHPVRPNCAGSRMFGVGNGGAGSGRLCPCYVQREYHSAPNLTTCPAGYKQVRGRDNCVTACKRSGYRANTNTCARDVDYYIKNHRKTDGSEESVCFILYPKGTGRSSHFNMWKDTLPPPNRQWDFGLVCKKSACYDYDIATDPASKMYWHHPHYGYIYQKVSKVYRWRGKCYRALSHCWGCTANPPAYLGNHFADLGACNSKCGSTAMDEEEQLAMMDDIWESPQVDSEEEMAEMKTNDEEEDEVALEKLLGMLMELEQN